MDKTTLAEYEKRARRMVVYCWFSYMILYIGKKTLKLCLPDMIATGVCTEAQGGVISSVFLASYAAGQFINGWLGDRIHPRTMMTGGLILSGAMNVFMGLCHSAGLMTLIWGLCGFFCSMLWAPLIRAVSTWTTERVAQACAASLSATIPIGTLLCQAIAAAVLRWSDWRMVFIVCGSILFVSGVVLAILFAGLKDHMSVEAPAPLPEKKEADGKAEDGLPRAPKTVPVTFLLCAGLLAASFGILFNGMIKDGLDDWIPTMLTQRFIPDASVVTAVTMILPLLNIAGVFAAKWAYARYHLSELGLCALMFAVSAVSLGGVLLFVNGTAKGFLPAAAVTLLFALSSAAMLGANTMLLTFIPLHFSKVGRASLVTGGLDCLSYAAAAVTSLITGRVSGAFGWSGVLVGFSAAAVLGAVVCLAGKGKMAEKYKELDAA
ncbi:MAG: MFS transporter [Clostridia bacterium]|nr:MFS transporter [Clostridia bacterium]MBQ5355058.1 MFS transporter [Clostridia bacterium]